MGLTLAQKILSAHAGHTVGFNELVIANVDVCATQDGTGPLTVQEFKKLGTSVTVCTTDGSEGVKGFVTDALSLIKNYTHVYTCGPEPMLKAIYNNTKTSGQYSFEERMGCGFGACMGCSCKTLYGNKRICKDGPVLIKEEIKWEA